jgi:hypothetical protein
MPLGIDGGGGKTTKSQRHEGRGGAETGFDAGASRSLPPLSLCDFVVSNALGIYGAEGKPQSHSTKRSESRGVTSRLPVSQFSSRAKAHSETYSQVPYPEGITSFSPRVARPSALPWVCHQKSGSTLKELHPFAVPATEPIPNTPPSAVAIVPPTSTPLLRVRSADQPAVSALGAAAAISLSARPTRSLTISTLVPTGAASKTFTTSRDRMRMQP